MTRPTSIRAAALGQAAAITTSPTVTAAMENLDRAGRELQVIRRTHEQSVQTIRAEVSGDPNLSAEGRQARLRERTEKAGQTAQAAIRALRDDIQRTEGTIADFVQSSWPKPQAGVEGMLLRQAAWARTRPLLDGGMTLSAVIAEQTDVETLFALREELPAYARAKGANADTMRVITEKVDLRIAQLKGATSEADMAALLEARVIVQALEPLLTLGEAEALGHAPFGSGLTTAVASALMRQTALTTQLPITNADGSLL